MKKLSIIAFIFFFTITLIGCDKNQMTYSSRPVGYALLEDTYVAKGSFVYQSEQPFNVNSVSMDLYYLPSIWGEIEIGRQEIAEDNPNFLIIDYNTPNQKVFAKYIHIGEMNWTARLDNGQVQYVDDNGDDILEVLVDEQEAKAYVEALEMQNAYFLDSELVTLDDYLSILDTIAAEDVFQKESQSTSIMINWAETADSLPDFGTLFPDYDTTEINVLFQRVFAKAEDPEFRTSVSYGLG